MTVLVSNAFSGGQITQLYYIESFGRIEEIGAGHPGVPGRLVVDGSDLVCTIDYTDPLTATGIRSEVRHTADPYNSARWYAWETMIPADPGPGQYVIMQLHDTPDGGEGAAKAPNFLISAQDGEFDVSVPATVASEAAASVLIGAMPFEFGRWYEFALQIIHTPTPGLGLLRLMVDGRIVANTGLNATSYTDAQGPYFKLGIYRYDHNAFSGQPTVRHRNLVIATGATSDQTILGGVPAPAQRWGIRR